MDYKTNFYADNEHGNSIKTGSHLIVEIDNAGGHATGAIYENGTLKQIDFDDKSDGKIVLDFYLAKYERINGEKRLVGFDSGDYVLKIRAGNGQGVNDKFFIAL